MTNKTPAMLLQELSVKKCGRGPDFTLITQNEGTHENMFEYLVEVLGVSAKGRGRSKKEAKQEASRNALTILKECNRLDDIPIRISKPQASTSDDIDLPQTINYIGLLDDVCMENNLPTPVYELIFDDGPAHNKVFTFECKIGISLLTRNTASTKRHAKQNVAKLMWERFKHLFPTLIREQENEQLKLCESDDQAIQYFNSTRTVQLSTKFKDFSMHLAEYMEDEKITYAAIQEYIKPPHTMEQLEALLKALKLELNIVDLSSDCKKGNLMALMIKTRIPIVIFHYAEDKESVKRLCLENTFEHLKRLLQVAQLPREQDSAE